MDTEFIRDYKPQGKEVVNLLFFGLSGVGKSSFINLLLSILSPSVVSTGSGAKPRLIDATKTETVKYARYKLTNRIYLWDTFGYNPNNSGYSKNEFDQMLDGMIDPGTHMDSFHANPEAKAANEIDGVIFVIDSSALDVKEYITKMKRFYDVAKARGKVTTVVVTKLDETNKDLSQVTEFNVLQTKIAADKHFKEIKTFLATTWHEELRVFPVLNYMSDDFTGKKKWREHTGYNVLAYYLTLVGVPREYEKDEPVNYFDKEDIFIATYSPQ